LHILHNSVKKSESLPLKEIGRGKDKFYTSFEIISKKQKVK